MFNSEPFDSKELQPVNEIDVWSELQRNTKLKIKQQQKYPWALQVAVAERRNLLEISYIPYRKSDKLWHVLKVSNI